jgi:hypothetical protein
MELEFSQKRFSKDNQTSNYVKNSSIRSSVIPLGWTERDRQM